MNTERYFIDTVFVQALLNSRDKHHRRAKANLPRIFQARELWITEAVLIETCNALSRSNRSGAIQFFERCFSTPNVRVVEISRALLQRAFALYRSRMDKQWGLTDCISFVVMREQGLQDALTADAHFVQAGFRALMLES